MTLDVSGCQLLTLPGFETLATLSAPLTTLLLKDCKNLSDTSLLLLSKFPLTELNVSTCKNLTDLGLEVGIPFFFLFFLGTKKLIFFSSHFFFLAPEGILKSPGTERVEY